MNKEIKIRHNRGQDVEPNTLEVIGNIFENTELLK